MMIYHAGGVGFKQESENFFDLNPGVEFLQEVSPPPNLTWNFFLIDNYLCQI